MRVKTNGPALACVLCLCATAAVTASARAGAGATRRQQQPQQPAAQPAQQQTKVSSEAELKAVRAVQSAADAGAALAAAGELLKKFPKSAARLDVSRMVADKIAKVPDAAQRVALSENFLKTFADPGEANVINSNLALAYVAAKRLDDAYRLADPAAVEKYDDPVGVMVTLTMTGADELQRGNAKYLQQSRQLGLKVAEMFETDRMPAGADAAAWAAYKSKWLPQVYHSLAVMSYVSGDKADAGAKLEKAAALNTTEPLSYYLLGRVADDEYRQLADQFKAATGASQADLQKQALAQMDKVIDAYARAIALADGDARYEQLRAQLRADLETYYKFRNNNKADGMQALIDKYKKAAAARP